MAPSAGSTWLLLKKKSKSDEIGIQYMAMRNHADGLNLINIFRWKALGRSGGFEFIVAARWLPINIDSRI